MKTYMVYFNFNFQVRRLVRLGSILRVFESNASASASASVSDDC